MKRRKCVLSAAVFTALFIVSMAQPALAQPPAEGTVLTSFDSNTYGVGLGFDGQYL